MSQQAPTTPRPTRVLRSVRETADVRTIHLAPDDETSAIAPGQFNMLYAFGVGDVPISTSGRARDGSIIHTIRAVGRVTEALCRLRAGDTVGVRGPFGTGWPIDSARGHDVALVAGGLGMAPLRSVLNAIVRDRSSFGDIALVYATREPRTVLYRRELERIGDRNGIEVRMTVDRAGAGWPHHVGPVVTQLAAARFDPDDAVVMTCGPEAMMRFVAVELAREGVLKDRIHVSLERNMQCAVGHCGHCQLGPAFICREGPVLRYDQVERLMAVREL